MIIKLSIWYHNMQEGVSSLAISLYEKRSAVAIYLIYKGANIHVTEKVQY